MGPEPVRLEEADRSLLDAATIVRRSRDASRQLDGVISRQRDVVRAADGAVGMAERVIAQVDIDIAAMDRRAAAEAPPQARVLIVDDNPAIRDVLRLLFDLEVGDDAEIRTVESGYEALALMQWAPHLVILDWQMPQMGGLETARRLRTQLGDRTRIVMYSSMIAAEAERDARAAGADRYVEKGADVDTLVAEVKVAVAARDRRRTHQPH